MVPLHSSIDALCSGTKNHVKRTARSKDMASPISDEKTHSKRTVLLARQLPSVGCYFFVFVRLHRCFCLLLDRHYPGPTPGANTPRIQLHNQPKRKFPAMKQFDRQRGGPRDLAMSWKQPYRLGKESLALPASSSQMDEIMGIVKKPSSLQMSEIPRKDEEEVSSATITWHKILFFSDMIFGLDLLVVFSLSCIVTLLVHNLKSENVWLSLLPESKGAIATLGAFYSFALVFRTNICYARWWEGRTLWGTLIVYSIRIAQQGHVSHWKLIDD
mmetsp:Transcript_13447/g.28533  ORF Transcript_13447/g.28533 Transcript_13447/m.28533 type:complete len:272 (+) Transcript_13447:383-1198(+)